MFMLSELEDIPPPFSYQSPHHLIDNLSTKESPIAVMFYTNFYVFKPTPAHFASNEYLAIEMIFSSLSAR